MSTGPPTMALKCLIQTAENLAKMSGVSGLPEGPVCPDFIRPSAFQKRFVRTLYSALSQPQNRQKRSKTPKNPPKRASTSFFCFFLRCKPGAGRVHVPHPGCGSVKSVKSPCRRECFLRTRPMRSQCGAPIQRRRRCEVILVVAYPLNPPFPGHAGASLGLLRPRYLPRYC